MCYFENICRTEQPFILFHVLKGIRIPESGKFLLMQYEIQWSVAVESGILASGIWNTAQGIRNPTRDWNPETNFHWQRNQNPLPGTRNPQYGPQNPRLF